MLEERYFITPPEWTLSDLTGMLAPQCHVVITYSVVDTDTGEIIGRPGRHRAVVAQQADGTWTWEPQPVKPHNNMPFEFSADVLERLQADIESDVARRGVVPAVLRPVDNGDGTATVTAVYYEKKDDKYIRKTESCLVNKAAPDLSPIMPLVPGHLIVKATEFILYGLA